MSYRCGHPAKNPQIFYQNERSGIVRVPRGFSDMSDIQPEFRFGMPFRKQKAAVTT